jgi:hypothetical protein
MLRLSRRFRFLAVFWATMQFIVPAGMAIADALAALHAGGLNAPGHVEAGPGSGCVPTHPTDCAICRLLSTLADRGRAHEPALHRPSRDLASTADPTAIRSHTIARLPLSRAPPSV